MEWSRWTDASDTSTWEWYLQELNKMAICLLLFALSHSNLKRQCRSASSKTFNTRSCQQDCHLEVASKWELIQSLTVTKESMWGIKWMAGLKVRLGSRFFTNWHICCWCRPSFFFCTFSSCSSSCLSSRLVSFSSLTHLDGPSAWYKILFLWFGQRCHVIGLTSHLRDFQS